MPGKALEGSKTSWKDRPVCQIDGCGNHAMYQYQYDDGEWKWRVRHGKIICSAHHNQGWHPTLRHRKDYCENIDGRLGYRCTTTVVWMGMLDVDHKNGKPNDDRPVNLQTLCKCCHAYKTHMNKDYASPGRKALGFTSGYK